MRTKFNRRLVLAMAVFTCAATPALAQDAAGSEPADGSTVYGALRLGAGLTSATGLRTISPRVDSITGQDRSSTSVIASAAIGLRPSAAPLRFELEAGWRGDARHRVDAAGTCTVALCGQAFNFRGNQTANVASATLMANAFYDHRFARSFSLFGGAGAGIARLRTSAVQRFDIVQAPQAGTQTGAIWPKRTNTNFAYSFTAGPAKRVDRNTTFELGGRYLSMGRYDTGYNSNLFSDERFSARLASVEGFVGVRFGL